MSSSSSSWKSSYLYPTSYYLSTGRLATLALGLMFLIAGALWSGLPDWDIPVSIIMAVPAYITAGPTMRVILEKRWEFCHHALLWAWVTIDGTYIVYWGLRDPAILDALRHANAAASTALYLMCGLVWYQRPRIQRITTRSGARQQPYH